MKRTIFTFVMVITLSFSICGQSSNREILNALSISDDVERVSVGSFMMFFAKIMGGMNDIPLLNGIKSVEVMSVSDESSENHKKKVRKQMASLSDDGEYVTLMNVKDKDEKVRIMARQEGETIKELLLTVISNKATEGDDSVVIRIKGKMKLSDVQAMVEQRESKND